MNDKYNDSRAKFTENPNEQFWWYRGYELTEDDIRRAMEVSDSALKAAKYLKVSYTTFKRHARKHKDQLTGKTLWELFKDKNVNVKREKIVIDRKKGRNWNKLLREGQKPTKDRIGRLKAVLIRKEKLKHKCNRCNYSTPRQEDNKIPLMLYFRNGDKSDWRLENLELVCYNCAFVYSLDFFKSSLIDRVEAGLLTDEYDRTEIKAFNQLDDFYMDYMKELGVDTDTIKPETLIPKTNNLEDGSEFIDIH
jgi:5-methylcytosine-specific restriction endonuclease McrA